MADQVGDGLIKSFLKVIEAIAWALVYWALRFLCTFWEWDIGLARKLKALSEHWFNWADEKRNDFKKNGSSLVRKYEQSHDQQPPTYEVLEEFEEDSSPVSIKEPDRENQFRESTSADSKGEESHESLSIVSNDSDDNQEGKASSLDRLSDSDTASSDDEVKETPDTDGSNKPKANDAA